jgi:hypothetical protein
LLCSQSSDTPCAALLCLLCCALLLLSLFSCRGFWRLLVVREGRDQTFLPLPAVNAYGAQPAAAAAAAGGDSSSDQQQQQRHQRLGKLPPMPVLPPTPLAELPVSKWLVQSPAAAAAGAAAEGKPLSEVRQQGMLSFV